MHKNQEKKKKEGNEIKKANRHQTNQN